MTWRGNSLPTALGSRKMSGRCSGNSQGSAGGFMTAGAEKIERPAGLLAELTPRCPLGCAYCSNPLALVARESELGTDVWKRVFCEAASLGVLHVHLSGGEPASRRDLAEIVAHCAKVGLYTNLITSGIGLTGERVKELAGCGLDHV